MVAKKQVPRPFYEIVVPTDCSLGSARAMEFALALAGRGSRVTAVHAVDSLLHQQFCMYRNARGHVCQVYGSVFQNRGHWRNSVPDNLLESAAEHIWCDYKTGPSPCRTRLAK